MQTAEVYGPNFRDMRESKALVAATSAARSEVAKVQAQADAFKRIAGQLFAKLGQKSVGSYQVLATIDGWIPALQFVDDDSDRLLVASTWAFACLTANATAAASLPPMPQVYQDGRWSRAPDDHPLWDLVRSPFAGSPGWPRWSWRRLMRAIVLQRLIYGASYLRPATVEGGLRLGALFLFRYPALMQCIEDPWSGLLRNYNYASQPYGINDVVSLTESSATAFYRGASPLRAAIGAMEIDATANARQKANLENKIAPGAHLQIDDFFGIGVNDEQRDAVLAYLATEYQGATKDGLPFVTGTGTQLSMPTTPRDLQYFQTLKWSRDQMMAVLRTPPPVIGVYENATLQNFDKAITVWWMSYLFPMVDDIYDGINLQAVTPVYGPRVRLWYDLGNTTQIGLMLMGQRADVAKKLRDLGYDANTASAEAGLHMPYVPELDITNAHMIEAGRTVPTPGGVDPQQAPATQPPQPEDPAEPDPAA